MLNHVSVGVTDVERAARFYDNVLGALEAGGIDEGAPGPRPDYGPDYFGAFVRDPDGNKLEAVATP